MPATESKASEPGKLPGIFISYRRSDNPDAVGRIYDRLISEFGKSRVFKDVDSIPLGQDFRGHLNDIVGNCVAVLAIIGPKWTDIRNEAGQRRLEDPDDFVRIELEAALARNVPVVPVMVGHAPMPAAGQLPASLTTLAFRQSIDVRPDPDFHNDATRLVSALRAIIDPNAPQLQALPEKPRRSWLPWLAGLAAAATVAAVAFAIPALKHLRETPPPEARIAITLPVAENSPINMALSPDGRQMIYAARGDPEARLWLRSLSTTTSQPLPGTQGGDSPFWSPDGRSIGFFAAGSLKRLDIAGGQPQILAAVSEVAAGTWGAGGDILFNLMNTGPIMRIAATGGPVTEVTRIVDESTGHRVLTILPDGEHFVYASLRGKKQGTYLGSLDGNPPALLTADVGPGAVLPSGWLLLLRAPTGTENNSSRMFVGVLLAQRLDVRNARLWGERITIASGIGSVSASATGLVAYRDAKVADQRQLTWVDRSGTELGTIGEADATLDSPRVAPDGRRVAVSRVAQNNWDIWLLDGARASRMTFNAAIEIIPAWSRDGSRIAFASNRTGRFAIHQKLASGAGGEELIPTSDNGAYPSDWSSDGQHLLYFIQTPKNGLDIRVLQATGERKSSAFLETPFIEVWGQFSPDGRWVAYQSNETGRYEVYVRPFNTKAAGQWMVSTAGGIHPMWSADGKELYFLNPDGAMMAASISASRSTLVPGTPAKLFDTHIRGGGVENSSGRQYDVARDGRFLINRQQDGDANPTITFINNWDPDARK